MSGWDDWVLVFTNPVGTGEVLDVCLYFGCGGVGGIGGEWVGVWTRVWRSRVVLCLCANNNNNNNIYLKPNIQCTYRYEFSGLYNNNIQLQ